MSRIMHELNQSSAKQPPLNQASLKQSSFNSPSFKGYQNHHVPSSVKGISNKRGSSLAMGLLLILVPSLLVGGVLAYQSYNQQKIRLAKLPMSLCLNQNLNQTLSLKSLMLI